MNKNCLSTVVVSGRRCEDKEEFGWRRRKRLFAEEKYVCTIAHEFAL